MVAGNGQRGQLHEGNWVRRLEPRRTTWDSYIDQGNEMFREVLRNHFGFVDKSELLGHLNRMIGADGKYVCVTRPRRFGKSVAAKMQCAYYDRSCDSRSLFEGLGIAQDESFEQHLNKYPVISLDVQSVRSRVKDGMDFVPLLQERIGKELRECWPDETVGEDTIQGMMAQIHAKTGTRFVVCLDEWHSIYRIDEGNPKANVAISPRPEGTAMFSPWARPKRRARGSLRSYTDHRRLSDRVILFLVYVLIWTYENPA